MSEGLSEEEKIVGIVAAARLMVALEKARVESHELYRSVIDLSNDLCEVETNGMDEDDVNRHANLIGEILFPSPREHFDEWATDSLPDGAVEADGLRHIESEGAQPSGE